MLTAIDRHRKPSNSMTRTGDINYLTLHNARLGLSPCPGLPLALHQPPELAAAVETIRRWPATAVVSLMETREFERLGLSELPLLFQERIPVWMHLPIRDGDIPGPGCRKRWRLARLVIARLLLDGEDVVVHCLGGLGRTGTIAALCLMDAGICDGPEAIGRIRRAHNVHAVENDEQVAFVESYRPRPMLTRKTVDAELKRECEQPGVPELLTGDGRLDHARVTEAVESMEQRGTRPGNPPNG